MTYLFYILAGIMSALSLFISLGMADFFKELVNDPLDMGKGWLAQGWCLFVAGVLLNMIIWWGAAVLWTCAITGKFPS